MKIQIWVRIATLTVLALLILGWGAEEVAAQVKPYKIGICLDSSGYASGFGIPIRDGALMSANIINEEGGIHGRPIKMIVYDNASDESKAVTNTKRLVHIDEAIAQFSYSTTGSALACIDTIESLEFPSVVGSAARGVWQPTRKWIFSQIPGNHLSTLKMVKYMKSIGVAKAAFLYMDVAWPTDSYDQFKENCKKVGIELVAGEKYGPKDTDMTTQLTKIMGYKPDAIGIAGYVADSVIVVKNIKALGITIPIVSDYGGPGSKEFINLAGKGADGLVFAYSRLIVGEQLPDSDPQKPVILKFMENFNKRIGGPIATVHGNGYDALMLIKSGLMKVDPKLDPEKDVLKIRSQLRDAMERVKGLVGCWGIFSHSPDNHNGNLDDKALVVIKVVNGEYKLLPGF